MPFEPGKTPEGAKPFKAGESGNPAGRPRKWVNTLKGQGYKQSEINDVINVCMSMTEAELQDVADDENRTILERTVANSLLKGRKTSSLYNMDNLITRAHGYPKESLDANIQGDVKVTLNLDDTLKEPKPPKDETI